MSKEYSNKVSHTSVEIKQTPVSFLPVFKKSRFWEKIDLEGLFMWKRQVRLGKSNSNFRPWKGDANVGETIIALNTDYCVMKTINPCWCLSPSVPFSVPLSLSLFLHLFFRASLSIVAMSPNMASCCLLNGMLSEGPCDRGCCFQPLLMSHPPVWAD